LKPPSTPPLGGEKEPNALLGERKNRNSSLGRERTELPQGGRKK